MLKTYTRRLAPALCLFGCLSGAADLLGQGWEPSRTPVTPVPADRWAALQPTSILGDTSWWNFGQTPDSRHPAWHDVDVENGWIFATSGRGLMVFDGATNPAHPARWGYFYAGTSTVPVWHQNDTKYYLMGVDAPAGYDGVAAVAAIGGNGMLIFDTRGRQPELRYQDDGKEGNQVWAATFGGTHYGFFATPDGVLVYNLSAAQSLATTCLDESPTVTPCMDGQGRKVYVGRIATASGAGYVHGAGDFLVASLGTLGVEIWRVSDPQHPELVLSFAPSGAGVEGVALWQEGASTYLGLLQKENVPPRFVRIFDVSCVTGSCAGEPTEVGAYAMNHEAVATMLYLSFSRAGAVPFLYVGGEDQFSGGAQREYLLDVSDPADPVEVTPQVHPDGYWGWYYAGNPTGFNWVMPRAAKFNGTHLVRAAFGLLDVHEYRGDLPPAAVFTYSPATFYAGDPIDFTDRSTGNPSSWSWTFAPDGSPPAATTRGPHRVVFATPGAKTVTLAINGGGATKAQTLEVLDPVPAVAGITHLPAAPRICQTVVFSGQGISGKPPLTLTWQILDAGGHPLLGATGSGPTFEWTPGGGIPAGTYAARLAAANDRGAGEVEKELALTSPEPLPAAGRFSPTFDAFTAAAVQFHLPAGAADGASAWKWDFGDGTVTAWESDPQAGPHPSHTYAAVGSYTVRVSVRNCLGTTEAGVESAGLPVTIQRLDDGGTPVLSAALQSDICGAGLGVCQTVAGVESTFTDASTGPVVSRAWDFGDGATAAGSPVTHAWQKAGTYPLTLTVGDGSHTAGVTRSVIVTAATPEDMLIPWVGNTGGALVQTSDVYLHNPGAEALEATLELRRRGLPEEEPPRVTQTIAPYATWRAADAVQSLFGRTDATGFLAVRTEEGSAQPVVVSYHTTSQADGAQRGQTIPGYRVSDTRVAAVGGGLQVQHLVGLSDDSERFALLGLSNPGDAAVSYRLRFFNRQGREIGAGSGPLVLAGHAAKMYQAKDLRSLFGVSLQADDRVVVESDPGASLFPYRANRRTGTEDPSFVEAGVGAARVYLVGALSAPGWNDGRWQSDVVIANPGDQAATVALTFTGAGAGTQPTAPVVETLAAGETRRLVDVIGTRWNLRNVVGVLTVDSTAPGGIYPIVQGETYDAAHPARRYGQTLPPLTVAQAAVAEEGAYLPGLRRDTGHRTTLWVFNPGSEPAAGVVVYRALDGQEIARTPWSLGAGKLRQISPGQLPEVVPGEFTAQVLVVSGEVLAAAQVVDRRTNDPAYVPGERR